MNRFWLNDRPRRDDTGRDLDVAVRGQRIRARLVRPIDQCLGCVVLQTREVHTETGREAVNAVCEPQVNFNVDGYLGRKHDPLLGGHNLDRRQETSRPPHREQLFGIRARTRRARDR
jgi:hypothetical protein